MSVPLGTKRCGHCGHEGPLVDFSVDKARKNGRNPYCLKCTAQRNVLRYEACRADGVCTKCGAKLSENGAPIPSLCVSCTEKQSSRGKDRRLKRSAERMCFSCGKKVDGGGSWKFCKECRDKGRTSQKALYAKRRESGQCLHCGEISVAWGLCRKHVLQDMARTHLNGVFDWVILDTLWEAQNGKCALTGVDLVLGHGAAVDHVLPKSRGGLKEVTNIRWVHKDANYAKGTMTDHEFFDLCSRICEYADNRPRAGVLRDAMESLMIRKNVHLRGTGKAHSDPK